MKPAVVLMLLLTGANAVFAGDSGGIPWEEIKALYRASIERELRDQMPPPAQAFVYSLDGAEYTLKLENGRMQGEARFSGKIISGAPAPIALFDAQTVLTGIQEIAGGNAIGGPDGALRFLPDPEVKEFRLTVSFLQEPQTGEGVRRIAMNIPPALQNSLEIALPSACKLRQAPGVQDNAGKYHFPPMQTLAFEYRDESSPAAQRAIDIDLFSQIRIMEDAALVMTRFAAHYPGDEPLLLELPPNAELAATSLPPGAITQKETGCYALTPPPDGAPAFSFDFSIPIAAEAAEVSIALPRIRNNTGEQGRFWVDEPDNVQTDVKAPSLVAGIPVDKLDPALREQAAGAQTYLKAALSEPLVLTLRRFQPVETPVAVLESQSLFCSFEENGNVLSLLTIEAPPELGPRLALKALPGAEIWSLTVNDQPRSVYAAGEGIWAIPLDAGKLSHVALAYLEKSPKLGLQGRVEAHIPETGLPAKELRVSVSLPKRLTILSVEGPVSTAAGANWNVPAEFAVNPAFFSRAFHRGEGFALAIAYKEPVKDNK